MDSKRLNSSSSIAKTKITSQCTRQIGTCPSWSVNPVTHLTQSRSFWRRRIPLTSTVQEDAAERLRSGRLALLISTRYVFSSTQYFCRLVITHVCVWPPNWKITAAIWRQVQSHQPPSAQASIILFEIRSKYIVTSSPDFSWATSHLSSHVRLSDGKFGPHRRLPRGLCNHIYVIFWEQRQIINSFFRPRSPATMVMVERPFCEVPGFWFGGACCVRRAEYWPMGMFARWDEVEVEKWEVAGLCAWKTRKVDFLGFVQLANWMGKVTQHGFEDWKALSPTCRI